MRLEKILKIAKNRGFFWPAAEIYGGVAGFWNYGPLGVVMKNKLVNLWREWFVKQENAYEIETTDILPEIVWIASGHTEGFNDKQVECLKCHIRYRADHLIEDKLGKKEKLEGKSVEELTKIIHENKIKCPSCGGKLSDVKIFNLMFNLNIGPSGEIKAFLKPETTQSSVLDFLQVYRSQRGKLPLKIAQVGKSFRNEISPRNIFLRMREFSMAELQVFFNPEKTEIENYNEIKNFKIRILPLELREKGKEKEVEVTIDEALKKGWIPNKLIAYYLVKVFRFFEEALIFNRKFLRFKELSKEEKAHYSRVHWDFEIYTEEFGWQEVVNNSWRSDYDLSRHQEYSKTKLTVFEDGKHVLPHIYEPSFGLDRIILHILLHSFKESSDRTWFVFPKKLVPIQVAIFPLVKRDDLPKIAKNIEVELRKDFETFYDEEDSIGRRYRRADEIGIPLAVTCDYQTLKDNTVTLRDVDTMKQIRIEIKNLFKTIKQFLNQEIELFK
ncbi:MAG: glycine--tRNA ligase [Candidatus Aenigmatarchaeota archaeon]